MSTLTGSFKLPIPATDAFYYFTPIGEKEWAPHWDPAFASDEVFETSGTTWVMVDRDPGRRIRYARVAHGLTAGTVEVGLSDKPDGCEVTVSYDLAALTEQGRERLSAFSDGYEDYVASWERSICAALRKAGSSPPP